MSINFCINPLFFLRSINSLLFLASYTSASKLWQTKKKVLILNFLTIVKSLNIIIINGTDFVKNKVQALCNVTRKLISRLTDLRTPLSTEARELVELRRERQGGGQFYFTMNND